jgi:hypothetical protein
MLTAALFMVVMMGLTAAPAFAVTQPDPSLTTITSGNCTGGSCSLSGQGSLGLYGKSYDSSFNVAGVPDTPQTQQGLNAGANAFNQAYSGLYRGLSSANLPALP